MAHFLKRGKIMRRSTRRFWAYIVVSTIVILLPVLLDLFKGPVAGYFSSAQLWTLGFVFIGITVVFYFLNEKFKDAPDTAAAEADENRHNMLNRVQNKWITGFLENPLSSRSEEQLLPVPLRERVGSRFDLVLSNPLEPAQTLPPGTTLAQIFDQAGGELLILGEPGAGKTTLLLELTRDLLKRAQDDPAAPMPVVLLLSSWAARKLPLEQWIAEELKVKYDIPSGIGKEWVKANQLLLLLDGLDEVAPDAQTACIDAINVYSHQAQRSLVVCSRTKDFLEQPGRLALHRAVVVQPLSFEQVDTYLDGLAAKGEDVEGLKQTLHQSATLRVLVATPLCLTVFLLAYHGKPMQELLALEKAAPTEQQHLLFHTYVERMLQRKGIRMHAPAPQIKHWLAWLASQMTAHQQSELYLEQFQLDWLPKGQRAFYLCSIGLIIGLVAGLLFGLVAGLAYGLTGGLTYGLVSGLLCGLFGGLIYWFSRKQPTQRAKKEKETMDKFYPQRSIRRSLKNGLIGLKNGLLYRLPAKMVGTKIEPVEAITLSWEGLLIGLVAGLVAGLVFGLVDGLAYGLVAGLLAGLSLGFSRKQLTDRALLSPNEGIRRSLKNGLSLGLVFGLVGVLICLLTYGLSKGLVAGLAYGLVLFLLAGLAYGLSATLSHYTLRLWLWQARCAPTPWRYVGFLDDTVDQLLLRKVGEGYSFRHHLLQDYFASLNNQLTKHELPQAVPPRICSACGYREDRPGARFCAGCGTSLAA